MARRNFFEIIKNSPFNLKAEYDRIYTLFYRGTDCDGAVVEIIDEVFEALPAHLRGRTISLSDFDNTYGFSFSECPFSFETDDLIALCEYIWNLCKSVLRHAQHMISEVDYLNIEHLLKLIDGCIKDMHLMPIKQDDIVIFVPNHTDVIAAAEIVKEDIAVSVLEYHHYRLKGNLAKKKAILKLLADEIEPKRRIMNANNMSSLGDLLFQMLQKFVRHNNEDNERISNMSAGELETCYDDTYQLWILATLEIDNIERKQRVKKLLGEINSSTT